MKAELDLLMERAAECALISSQTSDKKKRDLFAKLAEHYSVLASELERAIAEAQHGAQ